MANAWDPVFPQIGSLAVFARLEHLASLDFTCHHFTTTLSLQDDLETLFQPRIDDQGRLSIPNSRLRFEDTGDSRIEGEVRYAAVWLRRRRLAVVLIGWRHADERQGRVWFLRYRASRFTVITEPRVCERWLRKLQAALVVESAKK